MEQTPDDKGPGRAVPEAADEHHDHEIDHGARGAGAVAADRDVKVIAQESGERDVPAPPEIREPDRGVGKAEVVLQVEPEAQRGADRADRVAGEIEKDLARESHHARPGIERDERPTIGEDSVGRAGEERVGEHDLFEKPECHQEQAPEETALLRFGRRLELREKIARAHDRAGDELREERNREHEIAQRARRLQHAAINIERVGERMEGVERDADRAERDRDAAGCRRSRRAPGPTGNSRAENSRI